MSRYLRNFIQNVLCTMSLVVALMACGPTANPTTQVIIQPPLPTPTLEPTFTPSPSPTDTLISSPTATLESTPTSLPQASLSGRILDQDTGHPIAGVMVSVGKETVITNDDGHYALTGLPPGQYVLSVTHPDYDPGLSNIFTLAATEELEVDLTLYAPDTSPYPEDPMLTNPLDPNGAPTKEDAERLARLQGLTGKIVSIEETKLRGEFLVNYKIGEEIRAAVAELNHDVWELTDQAGRKWWIIKVCGNLASPLPDQKPVPTPKPVSLPPMAEVLVDGLVVRACAAENCAEVRMVERGARVEVFGCLAGGGWCEVGWSGGRGWCTGQSLRQLAVATVVPVVEEVLPRATLGVGASGDGEIVFTCRMHDFKLRDDGTILTHPADGSKIYDQKDEICVINADGSGLTRLTYHAKRNYARDPAWSPDKKRIVFSDDGDIYVMNADGSGLTRLTSNPDRFESAPTWSPDGQRIAFCSDPNPSRPSIYVMNADGSGLTHLVDHYCFNPEWSPDGSKIALDDIKVMNADGSNLIPLIAGSGNSPSWSPDGQKIVYASGGSPNSEFLVINGDGSGLTRLTNFPATEYWPNWSPDGQKIVFHSNRDGKYGEFSIYIMNADGSGVTRLTETWKEMNGGLTQFVDASYPDW
jgi:Tol biopolymer transport system component